MILRKRLLILLLAVCLLALAGCRAGTEQIPSTQPEQPQEITEPYFLGIVLEKYDESCLVEVTDVGNGNFAVGQQVVVHINVPDCPNFAAGDTLTIVFDGKMTCSLPPQIVCVAVIGRQPAE